jgi:hypothetical protein
MKFKGRREQAINAGDAIRTQHANVRSGVNSGRQSYVSDNEIVRRQPKKSSIRVFVRFLRRRHGALVWKSRFALVMDAFLAAKASIFE